MAITIGGLASGIDTASIVASLVTASNKPKEVMVTQERALESRKSAYATLSARLTSLKSSLEAMDTVSEFRSVTVSSGNEDVVSASVTGEAVVGRFAVRVDQLAAASMDVSNGFSSRENTGVVAKGTLAIKVGSTTTNVTIDDSNSSLDDVAAAINDQVSGVTAYVMNTGDAANPWRLVVSGESTGLDNAVTIDTSGLDGATGTVPAFTEMTEAADAMVNVNGIDVTSSTNEIDDAIQGITFHANEVSATATSVVVDRDQATMATAVKAFVTAWNGVVSQIGSQRVWNPDESLKGAFVGESVPTNILRSLHSAVSASYGSGTLNSLGQFGLTTAQNGELELDDDVLATALSDHLEDVLAVFTNPGTGANAALQGVIDTFVDEDDGTVTARGESLDTQIETMNTRITDFQARTDAYEARLKKQFTAMELAMNRFQSAQSALTALLPDTNSD